jgi:hypothetical protein
VKGILRVENVTTPIFLGGGLCRNVRSNIWGIILAYSHILNYFWAKSI